MGQAETNSINLRNNQAATPLKLKPGVMSRELYIRRSASFSILHRLAATRCVLLQNSTGIPAAIFAFAVGTGYFNQSCLDTVIFFGGLNLLIVYYMYRCGWYTLCRQSHEHVKAALLYDSLGKLLSGTLDSKGLKQTLKHTGLHHRRGHESKGKARQETHDIDCLDIPGTFEKVLTKTPSIPPEVLWLVGDIL